MVHNEAFRSYQERQVHGACCAQEAVSMFIYWLTDSNIVTVELVLSVCRCNDFITPGDQPNISGFLCHFCTRHASSCLNIEFICPRGWELLWNDQIMSHNSHHTVRSYGCRLHPHQFCCCLPNAILCHCFPKLMLAVAVCHCLCTALRDSYYQR